jgi:hypothetical protein
VINLGWCSHLKRIDAVTARYKIHYQHDRIRDLLGRAQAVADAALDGNAPSQYAVASAIGDIHATVVVHFAFEEDALLPILRRNHSGGLERTKRLMDEHARQRVMLTTLHREAAVAPALPLLAAKLTFLTCWLIAKMDEEERTPATGEPSASGSIGTLGE